MIPVDSRVPAAVCASDKTQKIFVHRRSAYCHRPPGPSSYRLKHAVIHTSAVLTTPRPRNENTDPISSLSKHGSALGFDAGHQWALQVPAAIVWKVLFLWRGSERRSSRAKWNCCHFELIHLPTELRAGERKASSSRHNCVWRRKVRPRFPLIPDTETKTIFL